MTPVPGVMEVVCPPNDPYGIEAEIWLYSHAQNFAVPDYIFVVRDGRNAVFFHRRDCLVRQSQGWSNERIRKDKSNCKRALNRADAEAMKDFFGSMGATELAMANLGAAWSIWADLEIGPDSEEAAPA